MISSTQPWALGHNTCFEKPKKHPQTKMQFCSPNQQKVCVLEWLKLKQSGRRCRCSGNITGNKCCNWGVKKKYIPGNFSQAKEACFYFKYQLAFLSHLQNSLDESWPLNTHRNVQFGYFVRPDPVSRRKMLQWCWRCPVAETLCRTPRAVQPSVQVLCVLSRSIFGHFWLNPLAAVMQTHLVGREKSSALGLSLFLSHLGSIFPPTLTLKAFSSCLCPPFTCSVPTIPLWISLQC